MKHLMYLVFLFCQVNCFGQTISKFLVNDYKLNDISISEIRETKTYIEFSGNTTYKRTYDYNNKGQVTKMVGLDTNGKLSTRLSYEYDKIGNLIKIKDEKWNHSLDYSTITTKFVFDSLDLVEIVIIGIGGELQSKSIVKTENGYPISIYSYDEKNSLIGYEIAKYDYEKNEVEIYVYNSLGSKVGKTINLHLNLSNDSEFKTDGTILNDYGDIIQELKPRCLSCDELVTYKHEYKYDDNKNWIKKLTYKIDGENTEKIFIVKRKIKYRNTQPNQS